MRKLNVRPAEVAFWLVLGVDLLQVWILEPSRVKEFFDSAIPVSDFGFSAEQRARLDTLADKIVALAVELEKAGAPAEQAFDQFLVTIAHLDTRIANQVTELIDSARIRAGV